MASFKELFAANWRAYPGLYHEPIDLMVEMLCGSGNYIWRKGELAATWPLKDGAGETMDYSDLDEQLAELQERRERDRKSAQSLKEWDENEVLANGGEPLPDIYSPLKSLHDWNALENQAQRMKRKLIDENMDVIVAGSPTDCLFRNDYDYPRTIRNLIHGKQDTAEPPRFLYFPDDITPEWGEKVHEFHQWLLVRMNNEHGIGISGSTDHWPEAAQALKEKIEMAQDRLHPLMHNGQTRQEHLQNIKSLMERLMSEIDLDEDAPAPARPPRRKGP